MSDRDASDTVGTESAGPATTSAARAESTPDGANSAGTLISEGLLIGAISLVGYACAFAYESSYARHFSVPDYLITLSIERVLGAALAVLGVSLILAFNVDTLSQLFMNVNSTARVVLFRAAPIVLLVVIPPVAYRSAVWSQRDYPYVLVFAAILLARLVIFPIIDFRKVKGYTEKLRAAHDYETGRDSLLRRAARVIGQAGWLAILVCIQLYWISSTLGAGAAARQERFLIPEGKDDWVVAYVSGDTIVLRGVDRAQQLLDARFALVKLGDSETRLRWETIGRLKNPDAEP